MVRHVAKDLLTNDDAEVAEVVRRRLFNAIDAGTRWWDALQPGREVVRRRLFDAVGAERARKERASKTYADWCFERRTRLPPAWTLG